MKINSIEYGLTEVLNVLRRNQQIPLLIKELALNEIAEGIDLPSETSDNLLSDFKTKNNLTSDDAYERFLSSNFLNEDLLIHSLERAEKISIFKEETWGPRAQSIYLKSKENYDSITLYLIKAPSEHDMQEIYFRIKDNEDTWEGIAKQISTPQQQVQPLVGPVPVSELPFVVLKSVKEYGQNVITPPLYDFDRKFYCIAQLIEFKPSSFDNELRSRIINEQYNAWLKQHVDNLNSKIIF